MPIKWHTTIHEKQEICCYCMKNNTKNCLVIYMLFGETGSGQVHLNTVLQCDLAVIARLGLRLLLTSHVGKSPLRAGVTHCVRRDLKS